jgi:D-amino-acid dehydrogenase
MNSSVTIIGAGIVGIATAATLRREGHEVTVVDMRPPGEYCSFGNAGILSPGSCVPLATPGIHWKVPGYLMDPLGPLTVRWSYLPKAAPWLLRFLAASTPARVEEIANALRPLIRQTFDAYVPLASHAGVSDVIRQTGYVVAYEKRASYLGDHIASSRRSTATGSPSSFRN